jgi:WS/DGAT/MGAT family acyltransferase
MKPLSGVDAAFLHLETPSTPMHIASLCLFDLAKGDGRSFHAEVRRDLARRLHLAPVLHRRLAPMPLRFANPVWIDDDEVDLDHHVRRVTLPAPGDIGQFEACAARLHAELLDRRRPLWQLFVIDGLASGQVGYYFKVHHAALDGQAGMVLLKTLFDASPRRAAIPPPKAVCAPEQPAGPLRLAATALRHDLGRYLDLVRHLPDAVRTLGGLFGPAEGGSSRRLGGNFAFGPRTPLNVQITAERSFAGLSLPLHSLQELADTMAVTLNDVVLELCSGALRRYLAQRGGIPSRPLIAAMPISLREAGDTEYTIQATMPPVNLHTDVADPLRRLRAIHSSAGAVKALVHRIRGAVPMDFPSIGVPWVLRGLVELYGRSHVGSLVTPVANLVISNIHGPDVPLYVAGARMRTYWPMSIVTHGLGLNVTTTSYAGAMGFGFTAARAAVPDPRQLTRALSEAFDELRRAAHEKPQTLRRRPAAAQAPGRHEASAGEARK